MVVGYYEYSENVIVWGFALFNLSQKQAPPLYPPTQRIRESPPPRITAAYVKAWKARDTNPSSKPKHNIQPSSKTKPSPSKSLSWFWVEK